MSRIHNIHVNDRGDAPTQSPGSIAIEAPAPLYRQWRDLIDRGLAVYSATRRNGDIALHIARAKESVTDNEPAIAQGAWVTPTDSNLHAELDRLIPYAHAVLFDPLPW